METIHLYIMVHKQEERIAVGVRYLSAVNMAIRNIPGIRWSRTKKRWHLPLKEESVRLLVKKTQGIAEVNIDMLTEYLEKKKDGALPVIEQTSKDDKNIGIDNFRKIKNEKVATSKLSPENKEAFRLYMQLLIIKAYSPKTIRTYRYEFTSYLLKLGNVSAHRLNAIHVKKYMEYCAREEKLSENTLHSRLNAIKFYYEQVLEQDKMLWDIPRAKRPSLLPKVLSEAELKRMFAAGLRVSEVVKLRIQDIDSERMQIFVARAKGKKDRVVNLSVLLLDVLRQYMKMHKPQPTYYLFGSDDGDGPYSERSAQAVFQRAKRMAGINKEVGFHGLRHSFATHLLEKGIDVKYIKEVLGHFDIRTTERYLHVSKENLVNIISPLDTLYEYDPSKPLYLGEPGKEKDGKSNKSET